MGATKRLAEMIVLDAGLRSGRAFFAVRFGKFWAAAAAWCRCSNARLPAPGTVDDHPPGNASVILRTIPEAVNLNLAASSMGEGGEVFVMKIWASSAILRSG